MCVCLTKRGCVSSTVRVIVINLRRKSGEKVIDVRRMVRADFPLTAITLREIATFGL